jgi:hypothetical protein
MFFIRDILQMIGITLSGGNTQQNKGIFTVSPNIRMQTTLFYYIWLYLNPMLIRIILVCTFLISLWSCKKDDKPAPTVFPTGYYENSGPVRISKTFLCVRGRIIADTPTVKAFLQRRAFHYLGVGLPWIALPAGALPTADIESLVVWGHFYNKDSINIATIDRSGIPVINNYRSVAQSGSEFLLRSTDSAAIFPGPAGAPACGNLSYTLVKHPPTLNCSGQNPITNWCRAQITKSLLVTGDSLALPTVKFDIYYANEFALCTRPAVYTFDHFDDTRVKDITAGDTVLVRTGYAVLVKH